MKMTWHLAMSVLVPVHLQAQVDVDFLGAFGVSMALPNPDEKGGYQYRLHLLEP